MTDPQTLSRRERQIMDVLIAKGPCSAQVVQTSIPEPPSYSAVRALLARLVAKGHATFEIDGSRYLYRAQQAPAAAQSGALKRLLRVFFKGSPAQAVNALLDLEGQALSAGELAELERKIQRLRQVDQAAAAREQE